MNFDTNLTFAAHGSAFQNALSLDDVRAKAPAAFAAAAHESTSAKYAFIPTDRILAGLMNAGFAPVEARQAQTRIKSSAHARHVVRLRRRYETVQLRDAIPEIVFLNSHDGTSAYQLRMGIFRAVCTNGLIVSQGAFPAVCVAHRGNVVDDVIAGAVAMTERFELLAAQVERMEHRFLLPNEEVQFAAQAIAIRWPDATASGMAASPLLRTRRIEDAGNNLWNVLNRVQENLLAGGLSRRSASGRLTRTRRISSIREDVRINSQLWDLATARLAA